MAKSDAHLKYTRNIGIMAHIDAINIKKRI